MSDNAGDPDDIDEVDETVEEELEEAMSAETDTGIQFHGGKWMSAFPLAFFVLWATVQSGLFRIGDTVLEIPAGEGRIESTPIDVEHESMVILATS